MPQDTIDYTKTAADLKEAIRKMVEEFRKRKGHDPERLQVIAKQDTDAVAEAEAEFWEWYHLEKSYPAAVAGLERQGWNEGALDLDQEEMRRRRLVKSDTGAPEPFDVAVGYAVSKHGLGLAEAEEILAKADTGPERGEEMLSRETKTTPQALATLTALSTATSRELALELATRAHERDPSRPLAWHLGMVYEQ